MTKAILPAVAIFSLCSMARPQETPAAFLLAHRNDLPTVNTSQAHLSSTVTIPAETEVAAQLLSGIHTRVSHVDDPVKAELLKPVYVNGRVALPFGTLLDGRIIRIRPARRLHRPAELTLRFEEITLPDGQAEMITGVLASLDRSQSLKTRLDSEGYLEGAPGLSWKALIGGLVAGGTFATVKAAIAGSAALAYVAPATGTALVGYTLLWPRGNDVHLPPETRCRIRLSYPLTVRVPW